MTRTLVLLTALALGPVAAQAPCSLGQFEADAEGWQPGENAGSAYRATSMANGPGVPYAGTGMLEWTLGDGSTLTDEFRSVYKLFEPALDLTETPLVSLAVNTYGRPDASERDFEVRVRVWSGGVAGCERYVGGVAEVRTATIGKNVWTPVQVDFSGFAGLGAVDKVDVGVRITTLRESGWFGRHQIDAVEARALATSAAPEAEGGVLLVGVPYPNPARGRAALQVAAPTLQRVRVVVVDVLGREVAVPFDDTLGPEGRSVTVTGLAPGTYAVLVEGGGVRAVRRLTVVR